MALLAVLAWIVSQHGGLNLRNPRSPLFEGPLPAPTPNPTLNQREKPNAPFAKTPGRFTVVSFNVHFGLAAKTIASTLRSNDMDGADIVLLQESNEEAATTAASELGMAFVYYPGAIHPRSRDLFGVAILSRWPIAGKRKIMLPDKSVVDGARKVAMAAVVEVQGVKVRIVNIHLQSGMMPLGFKEQIKSVMECAIEDECHNDRDPEPLPVARATVVGGDFNTWLGTLRGPLVDRMKRYRLERVPGIRGTFSRSMSPDPPTRHTFDYFFATPGTIAGPGRVGADRTGSDHFPIAAEFLVPTLRATAALTSALNAEPSTFSPS